MLGAVEQDGRLRRELLKNRLQLYGFFFSGRGRGECGHHPKQRNATNARDGPAVAQQAFDGSIGMR